MRRLFQNRAREIEEEIDSYLCCVSRAGLIFIEGIRDYLRDKMESLELRCQEAAQLGREADTLLRKIKHRLYTHMLIPESRGDVFELLDHMDDIVDTAKQVLLQMSIEIPWIPDLLKEDFLDFQAFGKNSPGLDGYPSIFRLFFLPGPFLYAECFHAERILLGCSGQGTGEIGEKIENILAVTGGLCYNYPG